ncbi:MAG TPA: hypothetical protein VGE37_06675 [Archangium sp.]
MTRQVALGAIIAFTLTVLALSVWEPKPEAPAPTAPAAAPAPVAPGEMMVKPMLLKPASLRPDLPSRALMRRGLLSPRMPVAVDAGTAP